ncbi:MAG: hypothetical protein OWU84_07500 [Firmicutes bacterium]|nr:hypothetical protein [Bacillota bacterium]
MTNRKSAWGWVGHIGLAVLFLGGVWLLIAPVWVGFQAHKVASRIDQGAGALLVVVTVAAWFLQWVLSLAEVARAPRPSPDPPQGE